MGRSLVLAAVSTALLLVGSGAAAPLPRVVAGHSVRGRAIVASELGDARSPRKVLVVGCIHGNECAGLVILRRLRKLGPVAGADLWLLPEANPDGTALDTRQNARGVDLNRNFPWHWRPLPRGAYYSGPRPASEPETRALLGLLRRIHPTVTIWFHQHMRLVDASGGDIALERSYARLVGLPLVRLSRYPGSATSWENHTFADTTAFVVELPVGRLPVSAADRYARAVRAIAASAAS